MKVDAEKICEPWKEPTGAILRPERVAAHVEAVSEWENRSPKTIRHATVEQLKDLRQETIDALLPCGVTRERAEQLATSILSSPEDIPSGNTETSVTNLVTDESAMPYLIKAAIW